MTLVLFLPQDEPVSMDQIEFLLSNLLYLKHVELHAENLDGLADGYRWQTLTSTLKTLKFKFKINFNSIEPHLDSFRSAFWLQEKRWYVAYSNEHLFSVPHFAPVHAHTPYFLPSYYTTPNCNIFYETIIKLTISVLPVNSVHYFPSIETLEIRCLDSYCILSKTMDLSRVQHLILSSAEYMLKFKILLEAMFCLRRLTIECPVTIENLVQMQHTRLHQIQRLHIESISKESNDSFQKLFTLFPNVEHLQVQTINTKTSLIYLIDGFKHLLNVSFGIPFIFELDDALAERYLQQPLLLLSGSKRLAQSSFTCNFYSSSNFNITVWMNEQIASNRNRNLRTSFFQWLGQRMYFLKCFIGCNDENIAN